MYQGMREQTIGDCLNYVSRYLGDYLLRGERTKFRIPSPGAGQDAHHGTDSGPDVLPHSPTLRQLAAGFAQRVQITDAVLTDWLIAHRVGFADPGEIAGDTQLFADALLCEASALDADPLLLLVCHIRDVLAEAAKHANQSRELLRHLDAKLTKPMRVLRAEIAAATALNAASRAFAKSSVDSALV
jgi:hypothetical protein